MSKKYKDKPGFALDSAQYNKAGVALAIRLPLPSDLGARILQLAAKFVF